MHLYHKRRGRGSPSHAPARDCTTLDVALDYHRLGLCPIPQITGEKKPSIRWKPYQDAQPEVETLTRWFARFTDAGIALVLGSASDIFVVDVDGPDAYHELVDRLGSEPDAPTVLSGSGKPCKRHYYFRDPGLPTIARYCPWHPQLEFRGYRGIVIAPPSLHPSGNPYRWAKGKSLDDLPRPLVPAPILEALRARPVKRTGPRSPRRVAGPSGLVDVEADDLIGRLGEEGLCRETRRFLDGEYADEVGWNGRLFRAAADMAGCGLPLDDALPQLLVGAGPWTQGDSAKARATIESAYSAERFPARILFTASRPGGRTRGTFTISIPKSAARQEGGTR